MTLLRPTIRSLYKNRSKLALYCLETDSLIYVCNEAESSRACNYPGLSLAREALGLECTGTARRVGNPSDPNDPDPASVAYWPRYSHKPLVLQMQSDIALDTGRAMLLWTPGEADSSAVQITGAWQPLPHIRFIISNTIKS